MSKNITLHLTGAPAGSGGAARESWGWATIPKREPRGAATPNNGKPHGLLEANPNPQRNRFANPKTIA
eukprot:2036456-Alexandrium_andersonii.AAC.1